MDLLSTRRDCGSLLELDELRRRLPLGNSLDEGVQVIPVARIVGTTGRSDDFDSCWRPRRRHLRKRVDEIRTADTPRMLDPIDVFRVDEAYFVADGHKRVAIARQTGMEFIDAHVRRLPTQYHVEPGVESRSVELTAAEHRFRRETGLAESVPGVRFYLWEARDYGELAEAVTAHAYEASERLGRLLTRPEAAGMWYECVYLPTIGAAREQRLGELIRACTDAYIFLWLHRQSRTFRGTESPAAEAVVRRVIDEELNRRAPNGSPLERLLQRARTRREPPQLLPEEKAGEARRRHDRG
jgi:hypothetical protein